MKNLFNHIQYYAYLHVWNPAFDDTDIARRLAVRPVYAKYSKWASIHNKLGFADTNSPNGCYEALRKLFVKTYADEI